MEFTAIIFQYIIPSGEKFEAEVIAYLAAFGSASVSREVVDVEDVAAFVAVTRLLNVWIFHFPIGKETEEGPELPF